jgi:hypothetical protein
MDFLLDLIDINEKVNFDIVLPIIGGWLILFWLAICTWVAKDAYKRYEFNKKLAIIWFIGVFFFGIPGVMFYLIVRPEELDQNSYFGGGVNVPIANFVGTDGNFVMGLQLKINNTELTEQVRDMKLSIDWESDDPKKEVTSEAVVAEAKELDRKMRGLQRLINLVTNGGAKREEEKPARTEKEMKFEKVEEGAKSDEESQKEDEEKSSSDSESTKTDDEKNAKKDKE